MVPESKPYLYGWLDHIWDKYLTRKDGTPKIKVHGFGLSVVPLLRRYPWYSVDSTGWVLLSRHGTIFLDLPDGRDTKLHISSDSKAVYNFGRHYDNLAPPVKEYIAQIIRSREAEPGIFYDPELLRTNYGWRDHWNINYFLRFCNRPDPVFRKQQIGVFD